MVVHNHSFAWSTNDLPQQQVPQTPSPPARDSVGMPSPSVGIPPPTYEEAVAASAGECTTPSLSQEDCGLPPYSESADNDSELLTDHTSDLVQLTPSNDSPSNSQQ